MRRLPTAPENPRPSGHRTLAERADTREQRKNSGRTLCTGYRHPSAGEPNANFHKPKSSLANAGHVSRPSPRRPRIRAAPFRAGDPGRGLRVLFTREGQSHHSRSSINPEVRPNGNNSHQTENQPVESRRQFSSLWVRHRRYGYLLLEK